MLRAATVEVQLFTPLLQTIIFPCRSYIDHTALALVGKLLG